MRGALSRADFHAISASMNGLDCPTNLTTVTFVKLAWKVGSFCGASSSILCACLTTESPNSAEHYCYASMVSCPAASVSRDGKRFAQLAYGEK